MQTQPEFLTLRQHMQSVIVGQLDLIDRCVDRWISITREPTWAGQDHSSKNPGNRTSYQISTDIAQS